MQVAWADQSYIGKDTKDDAEVVGINLWVVKLPETRCRIPDDCIDEKRYPLFMARAVLKELIESLQPTTGSAKTC